MSDNWTIEDDRNLILGLIAESDQLVAAARDRYARAAKELKRARADFKTAQENRADFDRMLRELKEGRRA